MGTHAPPGIAAVSTGKENPLGAANRTVSLEFSLRKDRSSLSFSLFLSLSLSLSFSLSLSLPHLAQPMVLLCSLCSHHPTMCQPRTLPCPLTHFLLLPQGAQGQAIPTSDQPGSPWSSCEPMWERCLRCCSARAS